LEEIKLKIPGEKTVPWEETLAITSSSSLEIKNVHDDLEREPALYHSLFFCENFFVERFCKLRSSWFNTALVILFVKKMWMKQLKN
jgi:hypothetical protein